MLKLDETLKEQLNVLSVQLDVDPSDLLNKYVAMGIDEDKHFKSEESMPPVEIKRILKEEAKKDAEMGLVNNQESLESLIGIIDLPYETDSVKLKRNALGR